MVEIMVDVVVRMMYIQDPNVFCKLFKALDPSFQMPPAGTNPLVAAQAAHTQAAAMGVPLFTEPKDICAMKPRVNVAFAAQVFKSLCQVSNPEVEAFATLVNQQLANNAAVAHLLPLDRNSNDLLEKLPDGLILAELLRLAAPGSVDDSRVVGGVKLTEKQKVSNVGSVLEAVKTAGFDVPPVNPADVVKGV